MRFRIPVVIIFVIGSCCLSLLWGPRVIDPFHLDETTSVILFSIRAPRSAVAMLMGAALGASGAVLQGILRNPLADPYVLGISSGASLAAAAGILFGAAAFGSFTIPSLAFCGALATGALVGVLGSYRGGILPERLLLAGVGLSFLFSALLMLMMSISSDEGLRGAVLWIFGDLSTADWSRVPFGLLFVAVGLMAPVARAKALNALVLGDEFAHSLGFSPHRERLVLFVSIGLLTAASVSLGGMIGFIGLLVPHIMRFFVGSDNRILIPVSALTGGALLCVADVVSRALVPPMELPAGIITAILGAPYFLYLLRRKHVLGL